MLQRRTIIPLRNGKKKHVLVYAIVYRNDQNKNNDITTYAACNTVKRSKSINKEYMSPLSSSNSVLTNQQYGEMKLSFVVPFFYLTPQEPKL